MNKMTNLELLEIVYRSHKSCFKNWEEYISKYNCEKCESGKKGQCDVNKAYIELQERLKKI